MDRRSMRAANLLSSDAAIGFLGAFYLSCHIYVAHIFVALLTDAYQSLPLQTPADRWSFFDRDELLPGLRASFRERGRRMLLVGRRRMGKTSLAINAAREAKAVMLFADLSKAANLNEVAKTLVGQIPAQEVKGNFERVLEVAGKFSKYVSLKGSSLRSKSPSCRRTQRMT